LSAPNPSPAAPGARNLTWHAITLITCPANDRAQPRSHTLRGDESWQVSQFR
jgi:hypothetical protein